MRFLKHQQKSVNQLEGKLRYASAVQLLSKRVPLNLLWERHHPSEDSTSQALPLKIFWVVVVLSMRAQMRRMLRNLLKIYLVKLTINRFCKLSKMLRYQEIFKAATKIIFLLLLGHMVEIERTQVKVGSQFLLSPSRPKTKRTISFSYPRSTLFYKISKFQKLLSQKTFSIRIPLLSQ